MLMDAGSLGRKAKLPVMETLRDAFARVFGHLGDFAALAAAPFVLSIAGEAFIQFDPGGLISGLVAHAGVSAASGLILCIRFLTTFVPWAAFVAAWHHRVLSGERDTLGPLAGTLGSGQKNLFRNDTFLVLLYPGCFIVFAIICLSLMDFPPGFGRDRIAFDFTLLTLFVLLDVRSMLVLPAHAAGHETSLGTAWRQSKGIAIRLLWVLLLATLPFNLVYFLAALVHAFAEPAGATAGGLLYAAIREAVLLFGTGVLVAALCIFYRQAVSGSEQEKAKPTTWSDWLRCFLWPLVLGALLGLAAYLTSEALSFMEPQQVILCFVAFVAPLLWSVYRLEHKEPPATKPR